MERCLAELDVVFDVFDCGEEFAIVLEKEFGGVWARNVVAVLAELFEEEAEEGWVGRLLPFSR